MWKPIPGLEKYEVCENGCVRRKETQHIIPPQVNTAGYLRVILYDGRKPVKYFVHRLVAMLYIPNPDNLPEVNHIDGDKFNNDVSNLEWCDRTYNERHGRKKYPNKYKPFEVVWEDGTKQAFEFGPDLSNQLGLTPGCIKHWLKGRTKSFYKYGISSIYYI